MRVRFGYTVCTPPLSRRATRRLASLALIEKRQCRLGPIAGLQNRWRSQRPSSLQPLQGPTSPLLCGGKSQGVGPPMAAPARFLILFFQSCPSCLRPIRATASPWPRACCPLSCQACFRDIWTCTKRLLAFVLLSELGPSPSHYRKKRQNYGYPHRGEHDVCKAHVKVWSRVNKVLFDVLYRRVHVIHASIVFRAVRLE